MTAIFPKILNIGTILITQALSLILASTAQAQTAMGSQAQVRVISKPVDVRITIDGRQKGTTPLTLRLSPGRHLLLAEKSDHISVRQTLDLTPDQLKTCELNLKPVNGLILIHSVPTGAEIEINGANRGVTPTFINDLPLGHYRAKFVKPGYIPKEIELNITKRSPVKFDVKLTSDSATLTVESEPPGAGVTINGINRGQTPCTIERIPSGSATLEMNMTGFEHYSEKLILAAGEIQQVTASLKVIPSDLQIVSTPTGARIYVNNQYKGTSPVSLKKIKPGTYRIRAELDAHDIMARDVEIGKAQNIVEEFRLQANAGAIEITTEPAGVQVILGGRTIGTTAANSNSTDRISKRLSVDLIPSGTQTMTLTKVGYFTKKAEVTIARDQTYTHHFRLKRRFIPNYEVKTGSAVYRGILIEVDARRNIKLETHPGVFKTLKRNEIIYCNPLREDKLKDEL